MPSYTEPETVPPPKSHHTHHYRTHTRPYNEEGEEPVMDDEELHSLLGV